MPPVGRWLTFVCVTQGVGGVQSVAGPFDAVIIATPLEFASLTFLRHTEGARTGGGGGGGAIQGGGGGERPGQVSIDERLDTRDDKGQGQAAMAAAAAAVLDGEEVVFGEEVAVAGGESEAGGG